MRITESMQGIMVIQWQQQAAARMTEDSNAAATGNVISQPSDGPTAYGQMVGIDAQLASLSGRTSALNVVQANLGTADGALSSATDLMTRVKELTIAMANGTADASARSNTADEITSIRQQLLALANTKGQDGYLFAGSADQALPFDTSGNFVGNDIATNVEVADGTLAQSNVSGAKAFTAAGGQDLFAMLSNLETAMKSNNQATIESMVGNVTSGLDQLTTARVQAGLALGRIQTANLLVTSTTTVAKSTRASVVEGDSSQVYSNLVQSQNAYQRAVQVASNLLQVLGKQTQ